MLSDDTEHACMAAQALLAAPDDEAGFARSLAWRLRGWLAGMPAAVGWGTLRAIVKLWLRFSPARSGAASAGNGAAMRAPIPGACLAPWPDRIAGVVRARDAPVKMVVYCLDARASVLAARAPQRHASCVTSLPIPDPPPSPGPRLLYLHGFASGPQSHKGVAVAAHYERRGAHVERLNLRVPSFEHLRLSAIIEAVVGALGGERDRAVLFGSSLGGLAACRVAERDARVSALVVLAPAFRLLERWRARLGEEGWRRWEETGWLETEDYAEKRTGRVDFGFARDALEADAGGGGWPDVRVPTLVVHGKNDAVVDVALSRAWSRGKRHVRLVEVDDGHELTASVERILAEADVFLAPFFGA